MGRAFSRAGVGLVVAVTATLASVAGAGHADWGQRALEESYGFSYGEAGDYEFTTGVAPLADGAVVGGYGSEGAASGPGAPYVGIVTRFRADGRQVWQDRFASSGGGVLVQDIASSSSGVVAAGYLWVPSADGQQYEAGTDAFVRWYTPAGELVRQMQFGVDVDPDTAPRGQDSAEAVAVADGSVYVGGYTHGSLDGASAGTADAYVRKYAADGTLVWGRQFGTSGRDAVFGIDVVGDGVYLAGFTTGALARAADPDGDVFVAALSASSGQVEWMRQEGSAEYDQVEAFDAGSGHLYAGGVTQGVFPGATARGGQRDGWLASYDLDGTRAWVRQLDTAAEVRGLAVARPGVVAAGFTSGTVEEGYQGPGDAFVRSYDEAGTPVWTRQFGGDFGESLHDASLGRNGVYVAGYGTSGLYGGEVGSVDSFVARFSLHQPDGMARRVGTAMVGENSYAPLQESVAMATVARGERASFRVVTQNDGEVSSAFRIRGCSGRDGVRLRYFRGTRDITEAVKDGWRSSELGLGEHARITVRVRVAPDAEVGTRSCRVTSRSVARRVGRDRVTLSVRVVRGS